MTTESSENYTTLCRMNFAGYERHLTVVINVKSFLSHLAHGSVGLRFVGPQPGTSQSYNTIDTSHGVVCLFIFQLWIRFFHERFVEE